MQYLVSAAAIANYRLEREQKKKTEQKEQTGTAKEKRGKERKNAKKQDVLMYEI